MKSTFSQLCKRVPHTSEGVSTATCCFCQGHTDFTTLFSWLEVQIYFDSSFRISKPLFSNRYQWMKRLLYISNEYFKHNLWITSNNWMTDEVHMSLDVKIVPAESRQAQRCRIHDQKGKTRHLFRRQLFPCFVLQERFWLIVFRGILSLAIYSCLQ